MIDQYKEKERKSYNLSWKDKGISIERAKLITRIPTKVEYFLGIREEMLDPVLRKAILIFAEKGYIPYDSCQGHNESDNTHIYFQRGLPKEALQYFKSQTENGLEIHLNRGFYISKWNVKRSPEEMRQFVVQLAENAPTVGPIIFFDQGSHNYPFIYELNLRENYPSLYNIESLPPDQFYPPRTNSLNNATKINWRNFLKK